jgi:DHA2 family multidrug resistance protein
MATMCGMVVVGILVAKVDPRYLVVFGFLLMAFALFYSTGINLNIDFWYASKIRILQSLGLGFLFVPTSTLAYVGVKPEENNDVSGMTNLARNIGGSCGTSLFTTMLARHQQVHQHYLAGYANAGNAAYVSKLSALTQQMLGKAASTVDAQHQALMQFYQQLHHQASVLSYIDILGFLAVLMLLAAPLPFFLRRPPKGAAMVAH